MKMVTDATLAFAGFKDAAKAVLLRSKLLIGVHP
jgi:hypothetical protein